MSSDDPGVWLSKVLIRRLAEPGWSQDKIADRVGVSQAAVSKWVKGTSRIQLDQAIRLAPVLDQDVVPFVHRLWPDLADADPVPPELREILRAASDDQVVEVIGRARSIVESGRRTRPARRAAIDEATNDEFAMAAGDDGDELSADDLKRGSIGHPGGSQPEPDEP